VALAGQKFSYTPKGASWRAAQRARDAAPHALTV